MKVELLKTMLDNVLSDEERVIGSELKEKKKSLRRILKKDKLKGKHLRRISSLSKSVANLSEELSLTRQRHHLAVESLKKHVTVYVKLKKKVVDTVEVDLENLSIEAGFEDHLQALVHSDPLINSKGFPPGVRFASIAKGPETPTSLKSILQDAGFKPFEGTATVRLANGDHFKPKIKRYLDTYGKESGPKNLPDLICCNFELTGYDLTGRLVKETYNDYLVCEDEVLLKQVYEKMRSWFMVHGTTPICKVTVSKMGEPNPEIFTYKLLNGNLHFTKK